MKSHSYMTRAMRARDPRFAHILGKLGYRRSDIIAASVETDEDEVRTLREQYVDVLGKRPFPGWDAETLKAKIAEAKG